MSDQGTTRPSPRAVQRLARDVGGEVADLRSSLRGALDEADRLEAEGRPDRAAAVLAAQQELLASVHQRLAARLADAAVEREAEGVLDAVTAPAGDRTGTEAAGTGTRLLAAMAAALVGVALLVAPEAGGTLSVAGSMAADDGDRPQDVAAGAAGADGTVDTEAVVDGTGSARRSPVQDETLPPADAARPDGQDEATVRPPDDAGRDVGLDPVDRATVGSILEGVEDLTTTAFEARLGADTEHQAADEEPEDGAAGAEEDAADGPRRQSAAGASDVGELTGSGNETGDRER